MEKNQTVPLLGALGPHRGQAADCRADLSGPPSARAGAAASPGLCCPSARGRPASTDRADPGVWGFDPVLCPGPRLGTQRSDQRSRASSPGAAAHLAVGGPLPGPRGDQPHHLAHKQAGLRRVVRRDGARPAGARCRRSVEQPALLGSHAPVRGAPLCPPPAGVAQDRKSTRLNSSHVEISYAVFCLKKKKKKNILPSIQKKKKTANTR